MNATLLRFFKGFDRDVINTGVFRLWNILAGIILIMIMPLWLSPSEQGLFYLLYSILNMQVLFDLGLNQIILQRLSRYHIPNHTTKPHGMSEFDSLLVNSRLWYRRITIFYFIFCTCVMALLIKDTEFAELQYILISMIFIFAAALNVKLSLEFTALQGMQKVAEVAAFRLKQSLAAYVILFLLIFLNVGIFAMVTLQISTLITSMFWLRKKQLTRRLNGVKKISYIKTVLPLQSKLALSWVASFAVTQALVAISFNTNGPVFSGQFGLSLSAILSISTLSVALCNAKLPKIANLIAQNKFIEARSLFVIGLARCIVTFILLSVVLFWFLTAPDIYMFGDIFKQIIVRFLSFDIFFLIVVNQLGACIAICISAYLRIFEREPLVFINIAYAALVVVCAFNFMSQSPIVFFKLFAFLPFISIAPVAVYFLYRSRNIE